MMTFNDFISDMPGLPQHAIDMYGIVHKQATNAGAQLKSRDIGMLRMRAGDPALSPNLRAKNEQMANALERDPSGKLAAIPELTAWAMKPDGIGMHWIRWWSALYGSYLDAQKGPSIVPSMATGSDIEVVS